MKKVNSKSHHVDYRQLWGSANSPFNDLVAGYGDPNTAAVGFSEPNHTQMVATWQLGDAGPVCGSGTAPAAGITVGGCYVEHPAHKFKLEHHSADAPVHTREHPPLFIPPGGGSF